MLYGVSCLLSFGLVIAGLVAGPEPSAPRGAEAIAVEERSGRRVGWYRASYALVIGNADYGSGWSDLDSVTSEIDALKRVLEDHGFVVEVATNTTGEQSARSLKRFIDEYGYDPAHRLLVYYAGHGFTRGPAGKSYLVPVDAPDPRVNEREFLVKALPLAQINTWAQMIESTHALFVFDSCFSGAIFKVRSEALQPPHISDKLMRPVRQFITAGDSEEAVPAKSLFTPLLVRALQGEGDLNRDGYVTGTELGIFLQDRMLTVTRGQTPQFGKIRDPALDEGDFVFRLQREVATASPSPRQVSPATTVEPPATQRAEPTGQKDFQNCERVSMDFNDGSFPLQIGMYRNQHVGDFGMVDGEFKLSMLIPANAHRRCTMCIGRVSAYRISARIRPASRSGTWELYFLDEPGQSYSLELDGHGGVAIKHYSTTVFGGARELWRGTYEVAEMHSAEVTIAEGQISIVLDDRDLPKQRILGWSSGPVPLGCGFIVSTHESTPAIAFFDDFEARICAD